MKSIILFVFVSLTTSLHARDIAYFEEKYGVKLDGVKNKSEYTDPDSYYTAIARKLGIPKIAFGAVAAKLGWKQDKSVILQAMVKRGDDTDYWEVMVVRLPRKALEKRDPALMKKSMKMQMVFVDDKKKATLRHVPEKLEGKTAAQGG